MKAIITVDPNAQKLAPPMGVLSTPKPNAPVSVPEVKVAMSSLKLTEWRPFASADPDTIEGTPWNKLSPEQMSTLLTSFKQIALLNVSENRKNQMKDEAVLQFLPYYVNQGGLIRPASISTQNLMR